MAKSHAIEKHNETFHSLGNMHFMLVPHAFSLNKTDVAGISFKHSFVSG
jgi:hypothetical protein